MNNVLQTPHTEMPFRLIGDLKPNANSGKVAQAEQAETIGLHGNTNAISFEFHQQSSFAKLETYDARGMVERNQERPSGQTVGMSAFSSEAPPKYNGPTVPDRYEITRRIYEKLFGPKVAEQLRPSSFRDAEDKAMERMGALQQTLAEDVGGLGQLGQNAGDRSITAYRETLEFNASLRSITQDKDGNLIQQSVDIKIKISREFYEMHERRPEIGANNDPLVLDMSGEGVDLTGIQDGAVFDLNGDGLPDRVGGETDPFAFLSSDQKKTGLLEDLRSVINRFKEFGRQNGHESGSIDLLDVEFNKLWNRQNGVDGGMKDARMADDSRLLKLIA